MWQKENWDILCRIREFVGIQKRLIKFQKKSLSCSPFHNKKDPAKSAVSANLAINCTKPRLHFHQLCKTKITLQGSCEEKYFCWYFVTSREQNSRMLHMRSVALYWSIASALCWHLVSTFIWLYVQFWIFTNIRTSELTIGVTFIWLYAQF